MASIFERGVEEVVEHTAGEGAEHAAGETIEHTAGDVIPKVIKENPIKAALAGTFGGYEIYENTIGGTTANRRDPISGLAYAICKGMTIGAGRCDWTKYVGPVVVGAFVMNVVPVQEFGMKVAVGAGVGGAYYVFKEQWIF